MPHQSSVESNDQPLVPLSRLEAAEYLGVSVRTFDRIRRERKLPFVRLRKRKRYLKHDLDALLSECRETEKVEKS